jgi:phosphoribosyl 1,2-cyclic phosphodiesterase
VRLAVLASGSGGNAAVVESGGTCVLVDCGISFRQLSSRMCALGMAPAWIQAVLLTHEHDDHVKGLDVLLRHHHVPVLATAGTAGAMPVPPPEVERITAGREVRVGSLRVLPVATSHDAREPVGFVLEGDGRRVGLVTDTGTLTDLLLESLSGCHALLLECNHDRDLLRYGPYPWPLKQRIASRTGHLSNDGACAAIEQLTHSGLEVVVGMHLSQTNNRPDLVARELTGVLAGSGVRIELSSQHSPVLVSGGPEQLSLFPHRPTARPGAAGER